MYATICISPYIHVQGLILRKLPDGTVAVDLAGREIVGKPIDQAERVGAPRSAVTA